MVQCPRALDMLLLFLLSSTSGLREASAGRASWQRVESCGEARETIMVYGLCLGLLAHGSRVMLEVMMMLLSVVWFSSRSSLLCLGAVEQQGSRGG